MAAVDAGVGVSIFIAPLEAGFYSAELLIDRRCVVDDPRRQSDVHRSVWGKLAIAVTRVPGLDVAGISAVYARHIRETCGGILPAALQLRGRLDPERWKLEWHIAAWVGEALSIDAAIWRRITVANVLGLAAIVLLDDNEDGELDPVGLDDPATVAAELLESFMAPYRLLFDDVSPFWAERDRLMFAWRRATTAAALPSGTSASGDAIGRDLAARGAPLKISVTGLCMLAVAPRILEQLDGCLDHALTGMVLYDHFVDWREDAAAGRWNAFVEHASARGAFRPEGRGLPTNVEVAMLSTDSISTYFDSIRGELLAALELAVKAGVGGLVDHLAGVERELDAQGRAIAARRLALGRSAQQLVFGGHPI